MTSVSHIDDRRERAFASFRATDNARRFRAAMRHSRFVRVLRIALPAGVAACIALGLLINSVFDPLRVLKRLPIDLGNVVISGTKITMQQPRIAGFTRDGRRYDVTARAAAQDLTKTDTVELQDIRAKVELQDESVVEITAREGVFENKADRLVLRRDIVVTSTSGYEAHLDEAVVDVRGGNVVSEKPVEILMNNGKLNANRLETVESGSIVRFLSGVTLVLNAADSDLLGLEDKRGAQ